MMKILESKMRRKTQNTNSLILCLSMVAVAFMAISFFGVTPVSAREYTLDADFDEGVLAGVEHDTVPDQLQLSEQLETLPFIWVANSGENTVSKINTETGVELGRYFTGPAGEDPSRTTVDLNGDLWVGNRASNTAVKIALYPTDTTGGESPARGDIFTPADSVPDGILNTSTGPGDVKPWGQDDAVLMRIAVDFGPRAVAVDASNNVWVGGYGNTMGYYNGQTGANLKNISIGRPCYGALVDGNGTLWISNQADGSLTRIDDPSGTYTKNEYATGDGWVYGIGIDTEGYIYTSAWTDNRIRKFNPVTNTWVYSVTISGGSNGRGVCVGLDGDVWVAHSGAASVTRHDAVNGSVKATVPVGSTPTGVATDAAGKIWVTNLTSNDVRRIDPATNTVDFTDTGHPGPYNYSDMTGFISRTITTKTGTWTVVHDSGVADMPWGTISWSSLEPGDPGDTSVTVQARSSNDGSTWSAWETATNGVALTATPDGQYIEIETTLQITSGDVSPILYDLTVVPANRPPVANAGPDKTVEQESYDGTEVTLDGSGSTDPDSTPGTNDDIEFFDWYEGFDYLGSGETLNHTFQLGSHTVTLKVTDFFGETDDDEVIITVVDTTQPTINSVSASPDVLWPPNHKMVEVVVTVDCEDICDADPVCWIVGVTSNEPINGPGDGNTEPDWEYTDDPLVVLLRAERAGVGTGRVYTIHIECMDASGNIASEVVDVTVPHDQGKGKK